MKKNLHYLIMSSEEKGCSSESTKHLTCTDQNCDFIKQVTIFIFWFRRVLKLVTLLGKKYFKVKTEIL